MKYEVIYNEVIYIHGTFIEATIALNFEQHKSNNPISN